MSLNTLLIRSTVNGAMSWENLFLPYANNKGTDQPAHLRSLISAFIIRCLNRIIPLLAISKIYKSWLVSVAEQAGLSLTWSETPKTGFLVTGLIACHHVSCVITQTFTEVSCLITTFTSEKGKLSGHIGVSVVARQPDSSKIAVNT